MDGLPGMKIGLATAKAEGIVPIQKMVGPLAPRNGVTSAIVHTQRQITLVVLLSFLLGVFTALYGFPMWAGLKTMVRDIPIQAHLVSK
jgi:hypothetical protein